MSTTNKFINPPLAALAYGASQRERLETLAMWGIQNVGQLTLAHWQKRLSLPSPAHVLNHFWRGVKQYKAGRTDPVWQAYARLDKIAEQHGLASNDVAGHEWALGCDVLGLNPQWRSAAECAAAHRALSDFFTRMQQATGRADRELCPIRGLKLDWLMAALRQLTSSAKWAGERLDYRHFAVLCAVLSKIGSNNPPAKPCGWMEIQRRALGYVTADEMRVAMPSRQDGALPMSRDMIDRRAHQLALWGFFVRHTPKIGRKSLVAWYGSGIDRAALVKLAEEAKVKARGGWKARWKRQQSEQAAIAGNVIAFPGTGQMPVNGIAGQRTA